MCEKKYPKKTQKLWAHCFVIGKDKDWRSQNSLAQYNNDLELSSYFISCVYISRLLRRWGTKKCVYLELI